MYHPRRDESAFAAFAGKGTTVHTFLVGGMLFVRCNLDRVQRTEIFVAAVEFAALDAAVDTVIGIGFVKHNFTSNDFVGNPTSLLSSDRMKLCTERRNFDMIERGEFNMYIIAMIILVFFGVIGLCAFITALLDRFYKSNIESELVLKNLRDRKSVV